MENELKPGLSLEIMIMFPSYRLINFQKAKN